MAIIEDGISNYNKYCSNVLSMVVVAEFVLIMMITVDDITIETNTKVNDINYTKGCRTA